MKKKFDIQIEDRAKIEIADAYEWYDAQRNGLGETILTAFENALQSKQNSPNGFLSLKHHRQFVRKSFPLLFYTNQ